MRKEEFFIESRDERHTPVHCVKWEPQGEPVCILQIVHGMAEYIERYERFAEWLCSRDVCVVGNDHLGHGKTARGSEELGYFCGEDPATVVVRDVHRLKKTVQAQHPGVPFFLLGHSMGSFIVRNYICRYGTGIQGAILMGTGMTPRGLLAASKLLAAVQSRICGERHAAKQMNRMAFGGYCKRIANARTPFDWLSVNRDNVSRYMEDPLCGFTFTVNGFQTLFELIGRLHDRTLLGQMPGELPVLLISGTEDPVGEYGAAVKQVFESFRGEYGMQDVTLQLVKNARHEILNETGAEETFAYLWDWIRSKADLPERS
ncbi:alpha/beta hydrolase [Lachnoclostridium sp. Marseille-P6806]|uniref:alpha/beta hydrolase n=1 Tax=Lachnoclostridium sp. Marseille-P6806 TaxID=2364793 RepID=UPI00102F5B78|nr:alpha/beta hydrolase [Lachnoclostridium sp. Marseille-P6806]